MGWQFRRTVSLDGGFRTSLSKRGVSTSWGIPGLRITRTADGRKLLTLSLPGTGLSYRTTLSRLAGPTRSSTTTPSPHASRQNNPPPPPTPPTVATSTASPGRVTPNTAAEPEWWRQFEGD
jgi:hypothetical protein